ncbi:MAG: ABC transporter permease [Deltaproteobacteria bacterium RIFCSPLOWO2_02_FULL_53_8]|nr:MAG: ABC transporter permease [Deltaproteobacteria bacterium RIFCSPLOWO2_02_FULL_53_8]
MKQYLEYLGTITGNFVTTAGSLGLMLFKAVMYTFTPPIKFRNIFKQMEFVGVQSLFVVILTGTFTGMVLALQSYNALKRFGAESLVGPTVALSIARELGPVLAGLMVTGRAGSAMATELGTMRVTEQIDALYTMAVNPIKYLVVPRVLAGLLMFPLLTIVTDFVGFIGGYLVGVKLLGINQGVFIGRTIDFVQVSDIVAGLTKSLVFGLIAALVACYYGFYTTGGAEGVGKSATSSVVLASVLILISDYLMSSFMA